MASAPWTDFPDSQPESDYIPPADRPTAWARMATDLANDGRTPTQIADALCIDETTAVRLLELDRRAA